MLLLARDTRFARVDHAGELVDVGQLWDAAVEGARHSLVTALRSHLSFLLILPLFVGSYGGGVFVICSFDLCLSEYRERYRVFSPVLGVIKSVPAVVTVVD